MPITLSIQPRNSEKFTRLIGVLADVLAICRAQGLEPILNGSLAVFAYTHDPGMDIDDIDLALPEAKFAPLARALEAKGLACRLREWHVLQVRQDDLKLDFDSLEYWYRNLPLERDVLQVDNVAVDIVCLHTLRELYRRGLEDTARHPDDGNNLVKHASYQAKYAALLAAR